MLCKKVTVNKTTAIILVKTEIEAAFPLTASVKMFDAIDGGDYTRTEWTLKRSSRISVDIINNPLDGS